jgi:dihydropteroate synthase type 2
VSARPVLFGILNITADSFSDGGRFLDPAAAVAEARRLAAAGADVIDVGAAASNAAAQPVPPEEEIRRLGFVLPALEADGIAVSVDTFHPETQRFALARGVAYLNDITGFADAALYPALAAARCRLVVMHSAHRRGRARPAARGAAAVWRHIEAFFAARLAALEAAGIARRRLIIDPGMGLFLSTRPEASLRALAGIARLKARFGLPVLVSVSRKSFLGALTGRRDPLALGPATLAAELHAAAAGADYIRTHDPGALRDALTVTAALERERRRLY